MVFHEVIARALTDGPAALWPPRTSSVMAG